MKSYMVSYDLRRPGQNYKDLIEKLQSFPNWWHCLDSTWIIKTGLTSSQILNHLLPLIDTNDKILVCQLVREAAWYGFDKNCSDWLQDNL